LSPDPLGVGGGNNLLSFDGAPTVVLDPLGLEVEGGSGHPSPSQTNARFQVTESGVAIPTDPAELKSNLAQLNETSTNPDASRKFVGTDSQGPLRVRVEKAHPEDPAFTGTPDPLHTVDHLHIDRRANGTTGAWGSEEKVPYDWPF